MSKRVRLAVWLVLFFALPFVIMPFMGQRYGMVGLVPCLALGLLMGISLFPHILNEDKKP
jgi:hypothetical protein